MTVRRSYPTHRITRLIHQPGGIPISLALERAEEGLESVRASCIDGVDQKIRLIASMASRAYDAEQIYELANEVFAEASAFGLDEVGEAARSLCDLLMSSGAHKDAAVKVHIDSLLALRHQDIHGDAAKRQAVLQGLRSVVKRYAPPTDADALKETT